MRTVIIDKELLKRDPEEFYRLVKFSHLSLRNLSGYYPSFDQWYKEKIYPGLSTGERKILLHYVNHKCSGIAILKSSSEEKKLCCLRVTSEFYGSGVGIKLFSNAFEHLETETPLLSIAEEKLPIFKRIFSHFKFEVGDEYNEIYRKKKIEISFNGLLIENPLKD